MKNPCSVVLSVKIVILVENECRGLKALLASIVALLGVSSSMAH